ncbi:hypothetical protein VNO77_19446 [Canavalia gladiata]|uniref:LCR n=1 Tax=Canavalia gladiata TaxID=3824 RepID=A0AAN9LQY6_CANGL
MPFHICRPFFFGILCIALVLTSGPATCDFDVECIGPCGPDCKQACRNRGDLGGGCVGIVGCCCTKKA